MNSKMNMAVGALLGTVFVLMSVSIASEGIFHSETPEKEGFAIVAEAGDAPAAEEAAAATPIAVLLASADAKAGEGVFKKCASCHSIEKGGPNKVGPDLWGVVDRPIASHEGFSYSAAITEFSKGGTEHWTFDHLNAFLTAPKKHIPGTAMGFAGLKKDDERANLIMYLHTQADNPVPLPSPDAAAAPATEAAPAAAAPAEAPAETAPAAPAEAPAAPAEPAPAQPATP
ncbi:cytochrome c family protein [Rhizobium sp. AG855]|uniref:c-type cytochrome n=1 Tax=Rhizobium sp. AG855 TaxID=2183898 RepID=UPI000E74EEC4|nr:cytochrome c family protein [Rhizobium sp. AG855]RKE78269.1 cytochrome c [Rhizobium sp. AG855]